jgi:hypothetical protein
VPVSELNQVLRRQQATFEIIEIQGEQTLGFSERPVTTTCSALAQVLSAHRSAGPSAQ